MGILNDLVDCRIVEIKPYNKESAETITLKNDETGKYYVLRVGQAEQRGDPSIYVSYKVMSDVIISSKP